MSEVKNKICPKCGTQMLRSLDGYICPKCGIQTFGEMIINPPEVTQEEALKILREDADWDWEKFRREAAKDILCALLSRVERFYTGITDESRHRVSNHDDFVRIAIQDADELIKMLRENGK